VAAQEAQARARAEVNFQNNLGGMPMNNAPPQVASMEPPRQTARREMRGPTGVDDILKSFEDARASNSENAFVDTAPSEMQSMVSAEDLGSTDSTRGRRRRKAVGNTVSLNV
jgi:hypothetical protein